jgi:Na+/melibiose symporter-like transporter
LYDLRVNSLRHVIAFTLSLVVAIVVVAIVGGGNKAQGAEDLGAMLEMMKIMPVLWRWRSKAQRRKGYIMSQIL